MNFMVVKYYVSDEYDCSSILYYNSDICEYIILYYVMVMILYYNNNT